MSKPLKYSLVEIDGLTGQSRKQRKRSVTKKYRKAKPFRRKYIGIRNVNDTHKFYAKSYERRKKIRKTVLAARKCAKYSEVKVPNKKANIKVNIQIFQSNIFCQICFEKFSKNEVTFIDCKAKGIQNTFRSANKCARDKVICQDCKNKCLNKCPFCRSHKLDPVKVRFRKKKLPYAERLKIREQKAITRHVVLRQSRYDNIIDIDNDDDPTTAIDEFQVARVLFPIPNDSFRQILE